MAKGERTARMASDQELIKSRVPADLTPHPSKPGYTVKCRSDGTVNEGNHYEFPQDVPDAWFCGDPDCQAAVERRQKLQLWQALGSPALERDRVPIDVSEFIPDEWIG
jgi:hypothetical protein